MQKFKLSLCLAISMVLFAWAGKAMAQTPTPVKVGHFSYTFSGTEATVVATDLTSGAAVIPETVLYNSKNYDVTTLEVSGGSTTGFTSLTGNSIKHVVSGSQPGAPSLIRAQPVLTSISFPKLQDIDAAYAFSGLPLLTTLNLPLLATINGTPFPYSPGFSNLGSLQILELPSLKAIHCCDNIFNDMPALQTLSLPELEVIERGQNFMSNLPSLISLNLSKVTHIKNVGFSFMNMPLMSVINLGEGCVIEGESAIFSAMGCASLTVTGLTKFSHANFIAAHGGTTPVKTTHISFPDLKEMVDYSSIGDHYTSQLERFDAPKLEKIIFSRFFNGNATSLSYVNIPNLKEVSGSEMFTGAPVKFLKLRGDLKVSSYYDGYYTYDSHINLDTYPTVVSLTDEETVNEIPATSLGNNIKGGRFIVPEGKAALYAAKWHLPLDKTMVYSPVTLSKQTDGTKYASGSIPKTASESVYDGITYTNTYDLMHGMTKVDCEDPEALGINDIGFTPSLSTLNVHAAAPDPLANVTAYAAKSYVDKHRTLPTEAKEGVLTLEDLSLSAGTTTVKGFGTSAATYGKPVGRATGGFLFKGNTSAFTEVYLPYINAAATTATTNYLKPGEGTTVADDASGDRNFYWHPGGSGFDTGFYHSENTLVPDGRAYLCLPNGISSYAFAKINIQFVDSQTTGISTINNPVEAASQPWYTLSGIRLVGKPTQGGIYIHGGQKVIIR